jgi:hypothetical protein
MKFTAVLGLIFIVLKVAGLVNWSWWVVLLPLYAGIAIAIVLLLLALLLKLRK